MVFCPSDVPWASATSDPVNAWPRLNPFSLYLRAVSYTHLRAHETVLDLVCRLLLEKKKDTSVAQVASCDTTIEHRREREQQK